jgi:alcohol dehydrogenase
MKSACDRQIKNNLCGTQEEYVGIPHADTSNLPAGFECGVLHGKVEPGSTVAIVGAGPIGLAALMTASSIRPHRSS